MPSLQAKRTYNVSWKGVEARRRYNSKFTSKFSILRASAKKRGMECTLSFQEYIEIISLPCFYCRGSLPKEGSGIDRINSDIGYVQGNCRSCCTACNRAKSDMTESEFKEWILRVSNHWCK
jgi:hypothetical protein